MPQQVRALIALAVTFAAALPCHARAKVDKLPPSTRLVLDNGFTAILIPNRVSPLITSVVVVRSGPATETAPVNGVSHMLEHLLFNGTSRRTQEQIYEEQDRYGIINNAHTDVEHTDFFVLAARDQFHRALDLQADMLFSSTVPVEKLAKERGIILNEIAKDRVSQENFMAELYARRLYHPHGLALPVSGTPESVGRIGRDAILDYYHRWYVPDNMTAIIMGDFSVEEMEPLVRRCFGDAAPGPLPRRDPAALNTAAFGLVHTEGAEGPARLLWLGAPAPGIGSDLFGPAHLLASIIDEGLTESVNESLGASGSKGAVLEADARLDAHADVSTFRVTATLSPDLAWADAARALLFEVTRRVSAGDLRKDALLARLRLEEKSALMRLWEKPHYFGLDRAGFIAAGGWDLARDFTRHLGAVEPVDLKSAGRRISAPSSWAVFQVGVDPPKDEGAGSVTGAAGIHLADQPTAESRDLRERWNAHWNAQGPAQGAGGAAPVPKPPDPLAPASAGKGGGISARRVLPNGMMLALDGSDDSRVFAAHVLAKNRSAAEPAGKAGIADLLHRMVARGTKGHPGGSLQEALRSIGGTLKVTDDPSIPYDDIYLSPEYSYIRLEALDEYATEAIGLLAEILSEPILDDEASLSVARDQLLDRARQAQTSPHDRSGLLLAKWLWGESHPFATSLFGSEVTIRSITAQDLAAFHRIYFSPRNLIVSIGTSEDLERLLPVVTSKLGNWPAAPKGSASPGLPVSAAPPRPAPPPSPPPSSHDATGSSGAVPGEPRSLTEALKAPQAYILMGRLLPAGPGQRPQVSALAAVLSRRMGDVLREKRGLSYSLGADAVPLGVATLLTAGMGVLPEQVEQARAGLREVTLSLMSAPPTQQEVDDAVRSAAVRVSMRRLSRINRAYQRGIDEMRRDRLGTYSAPDRQAASVFVSADQVAEAARVCFREGGLSAWVEAVVRPEAAP